MLSSLQPQQIVVNVLNALLRREEWAQKKVQAHAGKYLRLKVSRFQVGLAILPTGQVALAEEGTFTPNVTLTIDDDALKQLPSAIREKASMDELASLLHIEGEGGLARLISELAHDLRWDIGAELTNLFGPFVANMMMSTFKNALAVGKEVHEKVLEKTKTFLSHDYHVIVQAPVVDSLKNDIQTLHQSVGQLEQRIQKLQKA
ncbi:MAG: hypothetical protein SOX43_03365 [Pelistega sp.]|nr:hypothetical protein [Pelistega sp.]